MPDNEELEGEEAGIAVRTRDSFIVFLENYLFFLDNLI